MPVYVIPSKKDIRNYLNDYETEGMSKEDLLGYIYNIIDEFQDSFPLAYLNNFFSPRIIDYKTFIKNIIPFLVLNNICRVYYFDFKEGYPPYYVLFPNSESNKDKEFLLVFNSLESQIDPDFSELSIMDFESFCTRLDKNGNYIPVKV